MRECSAGCKAVPFKVRIVCHELEAWYLGDLDAIERVFPRFHAASYRGKKKFHQPDECNYPKQELKKIVGEYAQIATAKAIAPHLNIEDNSSPSFRCFISGVRAMVG